MNGWWRIWAVISIAVGVAVFALQYSEDTKVYAWQALPQPEPTPISQDRWNALYAQVRSSHPQFSKCNVDTARLTLSGARTDINVVCDKRHAARVKDAVWVAMLPAAVLACVWFAIGWIYRGFRPRK